MCGLKTGAQYYLPSDWLYKKMPSDNLDLGCTFEELSAINQILFLRNNFVIIFMLVFTWRSRKKNW